MNDSPNNDNVPDKPPEKHCSQCGGTISGMYYITKRGDVCRACYLLMSPKRAQFVNTPGCPQVPSICPVCRGKGCRKCEGGIVWK